VRISSGKSYDLLSEETTDHVLLVGLDEGRGTRRHAEVSMAELRRLTESTGAAIRGEILITLRHPNASTFISKGKVEELKQAVEEVGADGMVFDGELSATHQRNLEEALGVRVMDRTLVILDIFARRARSREGKLQVEVAQLRYRLPRLKGQGTSLSRLGGGIGTRGPGETKLEVDRRRTLERLSHLERELHEVARARETQRKQRLRNALPAIVLIGYTNAGKSTLLNALAKADVFAADQLFATLDPTTRVVGLPGGTKATFTDTVGFIHRLPTSLIAAFRGTLEEITRADLLIQLVDASSPDLERELAATDDVLRELEAKEVPRLLAWNKMDLLEDSVSPSIALPHDELPSVRISARTGEGLESLLVHAEQMLGNRMIALRLHVPLARGDVMNRIRELSRVGKVVWRAHHAQVDCAIPRSAWDAFRRQVLEQQGVEQVETRPKGRTDEPPGTDDAGGAAVIG
jgi:GTP-binding protein HflX